MNKFVWIGIMIVLAIVLVFVFFPKSAGGKYGGLMTLDMEGKICTEIKYDCYGLFYEHDYDNTQCADCGVKYLCFGILGDKHCFPEGCPC